MEGLRTYDFPVDSRRSNPFFDFWCSAFYIPFLFIPVFGRIKWICINTVVMKWPHPNDALHRLVVSESDGEDQVTISTQQFHFISCASTCQLCIVKFYGSAHKHCLLWRERAIDRHRRCGAPSIKRQNALIFADFEMPPKAMDYLFASSDRCTAELNRIWFATFFNRFELVLCLAHTIVVA